MCRARRPAHAFNLRFKEDVQKSVDLMMGWEKGCPCVGLAAAWLVITVHETIALEPVAVYLRQGGAEFGEYWVVY
jgi:hypothetical protein